MESTRAIGVHEGDRVHVVNDAHEGDGAHEGNEFCENS